MIRTVRLLLLTLILLAPVPAMAHARLKRSNPAAGAQLTSSPDMLRLWFTEQPELRFTFASLKDDAGNIFALGSAERESLGEMGVSFHVLGVLPPGRYALSWRAAAADGHPTSGKFSFVVLPGRESGIASTRAPPSSANGISPSSNDTGGIAQRAAREVEDADAASSIGNSIARALLFLSLLVVIGAVCFRLLVLNRANAVMPGVKQRMSQRAAALGMLASAVLVLVAALRLFLESQMMHAMPDMPGMVGMPVRDMVMRTEWGLSFRIQVVAALGALIGFGIAMRKFRGGWFVAALCALLMSVTPALGGHAAASPRFTSLMITADSLHVLAAGSWLGSLLAVMSVGVPVAMTLDEPGKWAAIASLVNAFSPLALLSAAVVVASGTFASWVHLEHLAALWQTTYGRVLLVKLVFVAITFGIGAYNFRRVQPQLSNQVGSARLRRSAATELGMAFLILLVTGLLTGISP